MPTPGRSEQSGLCADESGSGARKAYRTSCLRRAIEEGTSWKAPVVLFLGAGADSPYQGEMSLSDRGGREGLVNLGGTTWSRSSLGRVPGGVLPTLPTRAK